MENKEIIQARIPRPKGVTQLILSGKPAEARDKLITSWLAGLFPFGNSRQLSKFEFSEKYGIPLQHIHRRIKDGLVDNMLDDKNLAATLETERLRSFSRVLYRIGASDLQLDQLTNYLAARTLHTARPNALLLKELNGAIGNGIRLSEVELKTIVLMSQALATVDPHAQGDQEEQLTRAEIMDQIEELKTNPDKLAEYLEGTPDLAPIGLEKSKRDKRLDKAASHDYERDLDIPEPKLIANVVSNPV